MAKTTETTPAFDLASFTLTPDFSVSVPAVLPGPERATSLPFAASFTAVEAEALMGKQPHFYVPDAFFLARNKDAKITPSYGKDKIRDQFNKWVKQDEKVRSSLGFVAMYRKDGYRDAEGNLVNPLPGTSYWLTKKA